MLFRLIQSTLALSAAGAAGAATAYYLTDVARGSTTGAPGYTKALSTLGKSVGGSMPEGMALIGAAAAVSGATTYRILAPSVAPKAMPAPAEAVSDELIAEGNEENAVKASPEEERV
ncbi:MAG: hypothetical protein PPP56_10915 [Longimonas sp.]|uniref:hypothetical protein n=1 Tax=Longimonas sp. TaxID=2039626 RepID=UPI0033563F39